MHEFPMQFGRAPPQSDTALMHPLKEPKHRHAPKIVDLAGKSSKVGDEMPPTTMMIRNLPTRYTQRQLMEELEALGFEGTFDFFYAPKDFASMRTMGYAFVNFITTEWAMRCQEVLEGYVFKKHQQKSQKKMTRVSVAH